MDKINLWLAKQTAWVALNPKKAVLYWLGSVLAAAVLGRSAIGAFLVSKIL